MLGIYNRSDCWLLNFSHRGGNQSESEGEMDEDHNRVVLPQQLSSRGNYKSQESAVRWAGNLTLGKSSWLFAFNYLTVMVYLFNKNYFCIHDSSNKCIALCCLIHFIIKLDFFTVWCISLYCLETVWKEDCFLIKWGRFVKSCLFNDISCQIIANLNTHRTTQRWLHRNNWSPIQISCAFFPSNRSFLEFWI